MGLGKTLKKAGRKFDKKVVKPVKKTKVHKPVKKAFKKLNTIGIDRVTIYDSERK